MAVGARIPVHRRTHRSWDTGHSFQAAEPVIDGVIHQCLQLGSSGGADGLAVVLDCIRGQAQHDSRKAAIGDDQVRAAADDRISGSAGLRHAQGLGESFFGRGLDEGVRWASDSETRMTAEQSSFQDGYIGNTGKLLDGLFPDGHLVKL